MAVTTDLGPRYSIYLSLNQTTSCQYSFQRKVQQIREVQQVPRFYFLSQIWRERERESGKREGKGRERETTIVRFLLARAILSAHGLPH